MGMCYEYAGGASYPRFNKELTAVVKLFGGVLVSEVKEAQNKIPEGSIDWWFGDPMVDNKEDNFVFKDKIAESFKKWANHPYEDLTKEETIEVWNILSTKYEEVEEVSDQIIHEFEELVICDDYWHIG